jgi:hypothetical protein
MRMRGLEPPRGSPGSGRIRTEVAAGGFASESESTMVDSRLGHPVSFPDVYARIAHCLDSRP